MNSRRLVLVLLNDLMFRVKVDDLVRRAGLEGKYHPTAEGLLADCKDLHPEAIVIDLNYTAGKPFDLIAALKSSEATARIPVLAYVSHVQVELKQKAQELGCDRVVARSVLPQALSEFLTREVPAV